jgi:hypothetical protein
MDDAQQQQGRGLNMGDKNDNARTAIAIARAAIDGDGEQVAALWSMVNDTEAEAGVVWMLGRLPAVLAHAVVENVSTAFGSGEIQVGSLAAVDVVDVLEGLALKLAAE